MKGSEGLGSSRKADRENVPPAPQQYALKFLRPSVAANPKKFKTAAADLALEAAMLSSLDHENVIKIHAVSDMCVSVAFLSSLDCGYFLVLDRLNDTLDHRIRKWRIKDMQNQGSFSSLKSLNVAGSKRNALLASRLQVLEGLANGLGYLHTQSIMYRDLKPENVGFDSSGNVKIFDFGLAKEHQAKDNEGRKHTGRTGSPRYMAPEVARSQAYGLSVDCYSFGILLWEILSLRLPFENMTLEDHHKLVVCAGHRPAIDASWSANLKDLIQGCWVDDPKSRLAFPAIRKILLQEIDSLAPNLVTKLQKKILPWGKTSDGFTKKPIGVSRRGSSARAA